MSLVRSRRGGLLLSSVLVLAGGLLMGFSKMAASYEMLIAGRFLVGIQCGKLKYSWHDV